MKNASEKAFAKINLFLDVLSVRDDGFHEVKTVMHSITLADDLDISLTEGSDKSHTLCVIGDDSIPRDEGNLVLRAVKAFESRVQLCGSLRITLKKNIPSAAGLGGGSADAAATLRALNRLSGTKLSDSELMKIAASLGSDVPFCLKEGAAICLGRGERVEPISKIKNLYLVIVKSDESVSTPVAYRQLDEAYDNFRGEREDSGREEAFSSIISGKLGHLYNIFEDVVLPICPKAKKAKEMLISLGASAALMSGSGPSVFGIFENENVARNANDELSALGFSAFVAQSI
jgi:4-diphosphocytidyl-2-C-methyl-D-erythritol kinase